MSMVDELKRVKHEQSLAQYAEHEAHQRIAQLERELAEAQASQSIVLMVNKKLERELEEALEEGDEQRGRASIAEFRLGTAEARLVERERELAGAREEGQLWKEQCQMVNARREEAVAETERVRLHWMGCCDESDHRASLATERAEAAEARLAAVAAAFGKYEGRADHLSVEADNDIRAALTAPAEPKGDPSWVRWAAWGWVDPEPKPLDAKTCSKCGETTPFDAPGFNHRPTCSEVKP